MLEYFVDTENCSDKQCVTCKLVNLFKITQLRSVPCNPYEFYGTLKRKSERFDSLLNGAQQDSHYFLIMLTEVLEEQPHDAHWFKKNFTANLATHVNCSSCGKVHESASEVVDFGLFLPGNDTIQTALDAYFDHDDIDFLCENCEALNVARKKHFLLTSPKCLCLQLKRFSSYGKKINDKIEVSLELSLANHFLQPETIGDKYRLVAIINHSGQAMHVGHYSTIVFTPDNTFYEFDDRSVREVSSNFFAQSCPYVIFY